MAELTGEVPTSAQPEKPAAPKASEAKPKDIAGGEVIDMVEGADGKWVARNPGDPKYFYDPKSKEPATEAQPVDNPGNPKPSETASPRDRWEEHELKDQQKESQRKQELQNLQAEGTRLSALVHTPEGQRQIAEVKTRLSQVVETTTKKPKLAAIHPGFDQAQNDITAIRVMNEKIMQVWQQNKNARIEQLIRGENMSNHEATAYLTSVLGREPLPTTNRVEIRKREELLAQFARQRFDIGKALLYQASEAQPVGQRHLLANAALLRFNGISTTEAQTSFAKGWDEVSEKFGNQPVIRDGEVSDFDLLPKDLGMPPMAESTPEDDIQLKVGPLEFDYTEAKDEVSKGKSRLRLIKDDKGSVLGFTVVSPGEQTSIVKLLWVNPKHRGMALGEKLLQDAVQVLPQGMISMDIRGGEPMTKLAMKFGFSQNSGGGMINRYSLQK